MNESKEEHNLKKSLRRLTNREKNKLFEAIRDGNNEKSKQIIEIMEDIDEEINDHLIDGGSALHVSCHFGRIELVKYLIELGADVNKADRHDRSSLMKASCNGSIEIVQLLIDAGADINCTHDKNKSSALSFAVAFNRLEIFELLISCGVDIDKCGGRALIGASSSNNFNFARRLLELGVDINSVGSQNRSSLHCACLYNKIDIVKLLMENGADETIQDKEGKTAIELTISEEIKEFITNYNPTKYVLK